MENTEENSCKLCKKHFVSLIVPKKQCKFCFQYVCNKCSCEKFLEGDVKKRMCDACFQNKIQSDMFTSNNYDIVQLIFDRDLKIQSKKELDNRIMQFNKKIDSIAQEQMIIKELMAKKNEETENVKAKIKEKIEYLQQSNKSFNNMSPLIKEKSRETKKEVILKNDSMLALNEENSIIDDKIAECIRFIKETKEENNMLNQIIHKDELSIKIVGKKLEENINNKHRKTKDDLDSLNDNNLKILKKIRELAIIKAEKEIRLEEIKASYRNISINSIDAED